MVFKNRDVWAWEDIICDIIKLLALPFWRCSWSAIDDPWDVEEATPWRHVRASPPDDFQKPSVTLIHDSASRETRPRRCVASQGAA